jgi:hypothetical protein
MITQLDKSLSLDLEFVLFCDNFFINARLFKALKTMNLEACDTAKLKSDYFNELVAIRIAAIKQKNLGKMSLMIIKTINDEDIL